MRWRVDWLRDKFVPGIRKHAAFSRDRAEQSVQHEQGTRDRPSMADSRCRAAPVVTTKLSASCGYDFRDLFDCIGVHAGFDRRKLERILAVQHPQKAFEILKLEFNLHPLAVHFSNFEAEVLFPVPPLSHELTIVKIVLNDVIRDR